MQCHFPSNLPLSNLYLLKIIFLILIDSRYSKTSLIRHSMRLERKVGLGGCQITECLLAYISMVTVPHKMVGLERISDYRGSTAYVSPLL